MDTRRIAIALVLALVISGGLTWLLYNRLRGQVESRPTTIKVIATSRALQAGVMLTKDDMTLIDWPSNLSLAGSFKEPDLKDKVLGRTLLYPLDEKQPVLDRHLAALGAGIALSAKIPTGMRATSVRSNEVVGVAGFLFPGSHVDVLATYRPLHSDSPITQTVLQNVEVLTAGQNIQPDPQGKPQTVNVVTLLLSPEDSEKLLLASSQATIQFVLRSGADTEHSNPRPISMDELLSGVQKPPPPPVRLASRTKFSAKTKAAEAPPKPPEFYTIEVIHGDKRSVEKFE